MKAYLERISNGIVKENPIFILVIGMCPTFAVTTSMMNGIGMGLSTLVVLVLSNLLVSLLRPIIRDQIRLPAFIVVIASFDTIVELMLKAYLSSLYDALGIYIPLIVVNCIIIGLFTPIAIFTSPPGAFIVVGFIIMIMNGLHIKNESSKRVESCDGCCASCGQNSCSDRTEEQKKA